MLLEMFLLGCILSFFVAILQELSVKQKRLTPQNLALKNNATSTPTIRRHINNPWSLITHLKPPSYRPIEYHGEGVMRRRAFSRRPFEPVRMQHIGKRNTKVLVEKWRKSIIGLVRLAEKNLELARERLELKYHKTAIQAASTSVENIARALIHCYGDKPDDSSGQEEALWMLSRRLEANEKRDFEKAIDTVARIGYNRSALTYLSKHNVQTQLFDETRARQILDSASKIVSLFKNMLIEHFGEEMPALLSTNTVKH